MKVAYDNLYLLTSHSAIAVTFSVTDTKILSE